MPVTFFHPACVLPLRRLPKQWISLTGLVAGSVAPDFEKFVKMQAANCYSHTWPSILYFTLPVGLLLTFVFHLLVRDELTRHLPVPLQARLLRFRRFNWPQHFGRYYPAVIFSVLLGGVSHLLWDGFTHWQSPFAAWFPFLQMPFSLGRIHFHGFVILNVLSSMASIGYLRLVLGRLPTPPVDSSPVAPDLRAYWWTLVVVAGLIVGVRFMLFATLGTIWDKIITGFAAIVFSFILTSALFKAKQLTGHRK